MAWNPQGGGGSGPQGPNIEEILRRGQDRFRRLIPGGVGTVRGGLLVLLVVAAVWLASGFYKVQPDELGVELVFGRMVGTETPGLNYNWPGPIGSVLTPKVTAINRTEVGFRSGGERARLARDVPEESLMLTGDENIIDTQVVVFWKIDTRIPKGGNQDNLTGVRNFLFNIRNPELTVKNASEAALREIIGKNRFEFARTGGRAKIAGEAQILIQDILDRYGAGVEVTRVQLQKVDPPGSVLDAFRDVQVARADMERKINEAEAYRNEVVQRSRGVAAQIVLRAEGYKREKTEIATGESHRFLAVYEQFKQNKAVTKRRLYLDTMRDVLKGMDKILIDNRAGGVNVVPYLPLDTLMRGRGAGAQTTPAGEMQ
ncbi:MAG: FtsH protease activity modulator HflK [Proteobacteria bacterium]|nr:FtsH protease activity modulator HflK [Pseudomonadota bacterium]